MKPTGRPVCYPANAVDSKWFLGTVNLSAAYGLTACGTFLPSLQCAVAFPIYQTVQRRRFSNYATNYQAVPFPTPHA
jgi:hypothetical protein